MEIDDSVHVIINRPAPSVYPSHSPASAHDVGDENVVSDIERYIILEMFADADEWDHFYDTHHNNGPIIIETPAQLNNQVTLSFSPSPLFFHPFHCS